MCDNDSLVRLHFVKAVAPNSGNCHFAFCSATVSVASADGVSPSEALAGGTPAALAGEDACATQNENCCGCTTLTCQKCASIQTVASGRSVSKVRLCAGRQPSSRELLTSPPVLQAAPHFLTGLLKEGGGKQAGPYPWKSEVGKTETANFAWSLPPLPHGKMTP